jgi:hypothetical protein
MPAIGAGGAHAINLCWGPINVACSAAKDVVGGAASTAEKGLLDVVASAVGDAAKAVIDGMLSALNATTQVDFNAGWFAAQTKVMAALVLPVVMGFFLIQIIGSVLRREPGGLARAGLGLGKALLAGAAAIPILQLLLVACDEMCKAVIGSSAGGVAGLAKGLFVASLANPTGGAVLVIILGCWAIVCAFVLWGVLLFRKALLLVTGAFTMVAFAGSSWDATRGWVRKWAETAAALVFSKLVIVVVLVTGINAMGLSGRGGEPGGATLSDVFAGLLLLSIATLAPWLCWQFVHWGGGEIAHGMHQTMAGSPLPRGIRKGGQAVKMAAAAAAGGPPRRHSCHGEGRQRSVVKRWSGNDGGARSPAPPPSANGRPPGGPPAPSGGPARGGARSGSGMSGGGTP